MYKIALPNFEGPFDLLLYFIKRDELNIYDIPIARITEEFLKYIRIMQHFDLELAGEFLVMAATLMYIKMQMLLPRDEVEQDENNEDPRNQLILRLIEYKQFKEAAAELKQLSEESRYVYYRQMFEDESRTGNGNGSLLKNMTLFDLLNAFRKALERSEQTEPMHYVALMTVTLEEKTILIMNRLKDKKRLSFFELIRGESRRHIVVTFLAILELIKNGQIFLRQTDLFDDIIISARPEMNLN